MWEYQSCDGFAIASTGIGIANTPGTATIPLNSYIILGNV